MTITFITGANKGLGYETARRLIQAGHKVLLGARDPERGLAAAHTLGARFVPIDVTDEDSVAQAASDIETHEGRIDVLINNAGIPGATTAVTDLTASDASAVYDTNVIGLVRVTHAMLPLLQKSPSPSIVNVSSGLGSFAITQDKERVESQFAVPLYSSSKAAVTMLTMQYAKALPDISINVADPGFTATDFNAHRGTQTVGEGTDAIVALATGAAGPGTGRFIDRSGPVAW